MSNLAPQRKRLSRLISSALLCMALSPTTQALIGVPRGSDLPTISFDAVIELNAPMAGAHTILFARYWVDPNAYHVAVIWAEPHIGSLNFPIYPTTLNINSTETTFNIANQVNPWAHWTFQKPIEDRGVFRYRFNDYPIDNIRFAEREGLASRVLVNDLGDLTDPGDGWTAVEISGNEGQARIPREYAKLRFCRTDGEITAIELLDEKERVLKSITYMYSGSADQRNLARQVVVLPAVPMIAGFGNEGLTVMVNGQQRQVKEFPIQNHIGGRRCTIDYEQVQLSEGSATLPVRIEVRRNDTGQRLRSVRMYNYRCPERSAGNCIESAQAFSQFDASELEQRRLLLKYWFRPPADVNDHDAQSLYELQQTFNDTSPEDMTIGEKLKRVNMLMEVDLMLGDADNLSAHFEHYLETLRAGQLDTMVLVGGYHRIDTAAQWRQFAAADQLLTAWLDTATAIHEPQAIMDFAQSQAQNGNLWLIANLLGRSTQLRDWGRHSFMGQTVRALVLCRLHQLLTNVRDTDERQATRMAWVASSLDEARLSRMLREAIGQAEDTFELLDDPTEEEKALKTQLTEIRTGTPSQSLNAQ